MDDEPSLVRAVGGYLEHEGFVVTTAPDGEQALVAARSDPPDVTVLDLMVPGIDGLEVCRHLRTFSDAYVIMLTARSEEIDTLIGLSVGADDYLTKPFSPRELTARIRGLLRRPRMAGYTGEQVHRAGLGAGLGRGRAPRRHPHRPHPGQGRRRPCQDPPKDRDSRSSCRSLIAAPLEQGRQR